MSTARVRLARLEALAPVTDDEVSKVLDRISEIFAVAVLAGLEAHPRNGLQVGSGHVARLRALGASEATIERWTAPNGTETLDRDRRAFRCDDLHGYRDAPVKLHELLRFIAGNPKPRC